MKGTVFAVALNHQSQRAAWAEAFEKAPYNAPPKTAVWFIKPHNTVIRAGEPIPFPQGETVLSGATVALVVGKTASKVRVEEAAAYIAATPLSPRALPAAELGDYLKRFGKPVTVCADPAQAAELALAHAAPEDVICAVGSLYMAGAIRTYLRREHDENSGH